MTESVNPARAVPAYSSGQGKSGSGAWHGLSGQPHQNSTPKQVANSQPIVSSDFSTSGDAASERELRSSLDILAETNRVIGEEAAGVKYGVETRIVPDVLGLTAGAATIKLRDSGFYVSQISAQTHHSSQIGVVIKQEPEPGSEAKLGSGIRLTVSKGTA